MKRDLELIKQILIEAEGESEPDFDGYTVNQIAEHKVYLIEEEKLLRGGVMKPFGGPPATTVSGLTKEGHDFLAASRQNEKWEWLKEKGEDHIVGMTLPAIRFLLLMGIQELKNRFGGP